MDLIEQLGALAFATRLKRISERLMRDVSRVYREHHVRFEARWFPVLYLLYDKSPMAVTEISGALGLTHPAVNQIAATMSKAGIIVSEVDTNDERRRLLSLSEEGISIYRQLVPLWKDIEASTMELIMESGEDLLSVLKKVEGRLDENAMYDRVMARLRKRQYEAVEIVEYASPLQEHFKSLNLEWLEKYFEVEQKDEEILENPERAVIARGGEILFARLNGQIAGTAALIPQEHGVVELSKMAVSTEYQGRRIGRRLLDACIEWARGKGFREIYLETSELLRPAIHLYETAGFKRLPAVVEREKYRRETIAMKMVLQGG